MNPLTIECEVHVKRLGRGAPKMVGVGPAPVDLGRLPRVTKLMALAIKFDGMVRSGAVRDYAELARLGRVTRSRLTQVMNLLLLAPDIQDAILFLPRVERGRDPVTVGQLQTVALTSDWRRQRRMWNGAFTLQCPK